MLNVTAVLPRAGFLTVWPAAADGTCAAADRPLASNLDYRPGRCGQPRDSAAGAGGRVCIYTLAATDIVADLAATS